MPANAASRSIHLPDDFAQKHDVQFFVHSRLVAPGIDELNQHLDEHFAFMRTLTEKGILPISGPFFTEEGTNTGDGFYVLRVDSIGEARKVTAEDPLHKSGVRRPTVEPWLQVMN
jgi:uncharacterized protein YciI